MTAEGIWVCHLAGIFRKKLNNIDDRRYPWLISDFNGRASILLFIMKLALSSHILLWKNSDSEKLKELYREHSYYQCQVVTINILLYLFYCISIYLPFPSSIHHLSYLFFFAAFQSKLKTVHFTSKNFSMRVITRVQCLLLLLLLLCR